jgi:drug/metabolite transporter (DMT)-like permease
LNRECRGLACVAGAALLWSLGGVGIKAIDEPALTIACYRSAIGAVTLAAFFRSHRWSWRPAFLCAVGSGAACVVTFVVATKWTTAANAIVLQYTGAVWIVALAPLVLGERFVARDALAIGIALAGVPLVVGGEVAQRRWAGDLVAVVSGLFFAILRLALRRAPELGGAAVTYGNALAALALVPFVAHAPGLRPASVPILLFLGIVQIGGAYALFVRGVAWVAATPAALVGMLEPVANPLWVYLVLGELPSMLSLSGCALVLGAIAWRTLDGARHDRAARE